ncbi:MAG: DUF362 domain-containing protein [Desulfobacterales bacterium]
MLDGFRELGVSETIVKDKRVLLKPNLVEPHRGVSHINTHPAVVQAAVEAFRRLGAAEVVVAEGPGHINDTLWCLEESGIGDVLKDEGIRFADLNYADFVRQPNLGNKTDLGDLFLPVPIVEADIVVSMAKMKTHHWAGATLSMKNLFGIMPGSVYGWPKNVLHYAGIVPSILDINATVKPDFAIVDGIVGMEGDGPIMGDPVKAGLLVMGRNFPAVDATCCRLMGIDPDEIDYLNWASDWLGPIVEYGIDQRGEALIDKRRNFKLIEEIPAHQGIRLS